MVYSIDEPHSLELDLAVPVPAVAGSSIGRLAIADCISEGVGGFSRIGFHVNCHQVSPAGELGAHRFQSKLHMKGPPQTPLYASSAVVCGEKRNSRRHHPPQRRTTDVHTLPNRERRSRMRLWLQMIGHAKYTSSYNFPTSADGTSRTLCLGATPKVVKQCYEPAV